VALAATPPAGSPPAAVQVLLTRWWVGFQLARHKAELARLIHVVTQAGEGIGPHWVREHCATVSRCSAAVLGPVAKACTFPAGRCYRRTCRVLPRPVRSRHAWHAASARGLSAVAHSVRPKRAVGVLCVSGRGRRCVRSEGVCGGGVRRVCVVGVQMVCAAGVHRVCAAGVQRVCAVATTRPAGTLCSLLLSRAVRLCGALRLCCRGRSARRRRGRRLVPFDQREPDCVACWSCPGRLTDCGCAVNRHCEQRRPVPAPVPARPARPRPHYPSGQPPPTPRS
jgi:hypothetical protein